MERDTSIEEKGPVTPGGGNITFEKCVNLVVPYDREYTCSNDVVKARGSK